MRSTRGRRHGSRGWDWFQKALDERKKPSTKPHGLHYAPLDAENHTRPKVFMEFEADDGEDIGKIVFEIADDVVPKSASNFIKLCEGENEFGYKDSSIHFVQKGFIVQGGDVTGSGGSSGHSAFESKYFEDENFILQHGERGVLSLANSGVDRNNSQFFITLGPQPHLDGRNVSIGRVVDGFDVLEKIEGTFTVDLKPMTQIKVRACGRDS